MELSCRVTHSTLQVLWAKVPDIEVHCPSGWTMHTPKKFINRDIKVLPQQDLGVLLINDNTISCRGQQAQIEDNLVNDVLQVKPSNRVFTRYAAKRGYSHSFGLKSQALYNKWLEMKLHIKKTAQNQRNFLSWNMSCSMRISLFGHLHRR